MNEQLDARLSNLEDGPAVRLLQTIAKGHGEPAHAAKPDAGLAAALAEEIGTAAVTPSDGEAARTALRLLADDERFAAPIRAVLDGPQVERFAIDPVTTTVLIGAVIFALQTHVEFTRETSGKWSVKIIKKPTKDGLLGPLVKKLTALIGG